MSAIWAVARVVLKETSRGLGFRVFVLFLLAVAWWAPRWMAAPDLLADLKLLVSYGFGAPLFFLSLFTLLRSAATLSSELELRTIQVLISKPLARWQLLAGKWLGVVTLDAMLLLLLGLVLGLGLGLRRPDDSEAGRRASARFFTARASAPLEGAAIDRQLFARLVEDELSAHSVADRGEVELRVRRRLETQRLGPGESRRLRFVPELSPGVAQSLQRTRPLELRLTARLHPPLELEVATRWLHPGAEPREERLVQSARQSFDWPARLLAENGSLSLDLEIPASEEARLSLRPPEVELLIPVGSFGANALRAFALAWSQLAFLAAAGIVARASFSLPTANLLTVFFYVAALAASFLRQAIEETDSGSWWGQFFRLSGLVLELLPNFDREDPIHFLREGRWLEPWSWSLMLAKNFLLRAGGMLLLASLFFRGRDLGGRG